MSKSRDGNVLKPDVLVLINSKIRAYVVDNNERETPYCPKCGAKIDL